MPLKRILDIMIYNFPSKDIKYSMCLAHPIKHPDMPYNDIAISE